jgi:hypothetical protein
MSIDHNRIKVADLEKNQPNKILTTNTAGELEFSDINNIKIDSYNALDYTDAGKALDARQGKVLQDTKENTSNKVQDIEVNKSSTALFGSVKAIYDWCMGKFKKKLLNIKDITNLIEVIDGQQMYVPLPTDEKLFYNGIPDIKILLKYDNEELVPIPVGTRFEVTGDINSGNIDLIGGIDVFGNFGVLKKGSTAIFIKIAPDSWHIEHTNTNMTVSNASSTSLDIDYQHDKNRIITTNDNPVTLNLRTNSYRPIPIGIKIEYTQKGNGIVTLVPLSGVTLVTNLSLSSVKGETRTLTKIAEDTWTLEGNNSISNKQDIANQIEIGTSQNAQASWHGKTVIFTASCTIAIPATLVDSYIFNGITLAGVTVTWVIAAPKTWLFGTPTPTTEKQIFTLAQRGNTNSVLLLGV